MHMGLDKGVRMNGWVVARIAVKIRFLTTTPGHISAHRCLGGELWLDGFYLHSGSLA